MNKNKLNTKDWRYLGPSNWSQKLLRLLPFSKKFNKAAKEHDILYGIGGDKYNKKYADDTFSKLMLKECKWNPFAYIIAFFYYSLVKTLGRFFFNYK